MSQPSFDGMGRGVRLIRCRLHPDLLLQIERGRKRVIRRMSPDWSDVKTGDILCPEGSLIQLRVTRDSSREPLSSMTDRDYMAEGIVQRGDIFYPTLSAARKGEPSFITKREAFLYLWSIFHRSGTKGDPAGDPHPFVIWFELMRTERPD